MLGKMQPIETLLSRPDPLAVCLTHATGYIRVGGHRASCQWSLPSGTALPSLIPYTEEPTLQKLWNSSLSLQAQLEVYIKELRDEDLGSGQAEDTLDQTSAQQKLPGQESQLSWPAGLKLERVQEGHRAYNPSLQHDQHDQQMQAVSAAKAFKRGDPLGMYLGYVLTEEDADEVLDGTVADRMFHKYQFNFQLNPPVPGAKLEQVSSSTSSSSSSSRTFVVDASCCLEGNPLAHMLDYRALRADFSVNPRKRGGRVNAAFVPFSDNRTGQLYVTVVALADIKEQEEVRQAHVLWEKDRFV